MGVFTSAGSRMSDHFHVVAGMPDVGQGRGWTANDWRRCPVERVSLAGLVAVQTYLSQSRLNRYASGQGMFGLKPCMVRHRGRVYVADGHHRVVAALLRGDTSIRAHVRTV